MELRRCEFANLWKVQVPLQGRLWGELLRHLRHRRGVIGDALELIGDMVHREKVSQVTRNRTLCRDRGGDHADDFMLHRIDVAVVDDDLLSERGVMRGEGGEGVSDCRFSEAPHAHDDLLDLSQLTVERVTSPLRRRRCASATRRAREDLVDLVFYPTRLFFVTHSQLLPGFPLAIRYIVAPR